MLAPKYQFYAEKDKDIWRDSHPYIELGLAIVFLSCGACKPEQT